MAKKSYTKRIKVTKTGKLLRRKQGLGHSRANKSRNIIRRRREVVPVSKVDHGDIAERLEVPVYTEESGRK